MDEIRTGAPVGQTPPTPPPGPEGPTPAAAKGPPLELPAPQGGAIAVITDRMAWRLAKLSALATQREFARLGMKVEWNAQRPDILERARAAADELYGSIIQTAGTRVKDYFADQLAEGKAPPDIAKALSEQFAGVPARQAKMVARTVTRQLYNEAALDAYEAAGVRDVIASDGHGGLTGKTDPACLARNGKTFSIEQARVEEHSPTTHPNCTLSWRPVVPDEGLRSEDAAMNAALPENGHRHLLLVWEPEKHPRWPKGTPRVGGEWMDTDNLMDLLRRDAPGRRDLSFLARGAQRVRSVFGSASGDGADLHVEMRDGSSHVIHIPTGSRLSDAVRVLGALDTARPSAAPRDPRVEEIARWQTTKPWDRPLSDFAAGHVPGFIYHPDRVPRSGLGPVAGRMPAGKPYMELYPGAFHDGKLDTRLIYHEAGHLVANHIFGSEGVQPGTPLWHALEPWYHPSEGYQGRVNHKWRNPWLNPTGEFPGYSDNPEEILAEAYSSLIHGDLESRTTYTPGIDGPPGGEFTPDELAAQQKWRTLYGLVAAAAREMGLPDHRLFMPNGDPVDSAPTDQRTVEKTLGDIGAGERFRLVTDPTSLYQTFERVTPGESKRGDGRLTVRNVETGKRVHMAPDRRIDHILPDEKPKYRLVSDLEPGDRFLVPGVDGDREYELLKQGGTRRKDGRITGREIATGKRVHFKPDRAVLVGSGTDKERRWKPPAPPPPRERPPKPPVQKKSPPPVELPAEYAALPQRGEAYPAYVERFDGQLPAGYHFVSVPADQWNDPKVKTFKALPGQYGPARLYGKTAPIEPPASGFVIVLAERQRGVAVPWMRGFTHSFAGVSRKNVVAAWEGEDRRQVFYRAPTLETPKDLKPVKLVKGRRYRLEQIPPNDAHFVVYQGDRYQVGDRLGGEAILMPLDENGQPKPDGWKRVAGSRMVTYGFLTQKPVPDELIRHREEIPALEVAKGELVQLDDGMFYRVTGVTRKGDHAGLKMKLVGVAGAPVTSVPLDSHVTTVKMIQRDGAETHAMNLLPGDTFRTPYGRFTVDHVTRSDRGALSISARHEDGGSLRSFSAYSRVQVGHDAPTPQGGFYLWQIGKPGEHVQRGINGYELVEKLDDHALAWRAYDVATGGKVRLYSYEPDFKPGLPPGERPLPPKVDVPGTRARDMAHGREHRFTYQGRQWWMMGGAGSGPRGTLRAAAVGDTVDPRFVGERISIPDSALVVREGEKDPYGAPGERRRARLLAKVREVYQSRRGPQTEDEYRDIGALVHEAMLEGAPIPNVVQHERDQLRSALTKIRPLAKPGSSDVKPYDLPDITDHEGDVVRVRPPTYDEAVKFKDAQAWFPASWMDEVSHIGTTVAVGVWRGFCRSDVIAVKNQEDANVVQHEMGHRVENAVPKIRAACSEFWQRRTQGDAMTKLYAEKDEFTKEDHFLHHYMGKVYGGASGGREIFSMGIEDLVHPYNRRPEGGGARARGGMYSLLHEDADYAHFMLGLLAALKTDAEVAQIEDEQRRLGE